MANTEYNKRYYQENRERERARSKTWYHENKDTLDKEKLKEYHAVYYQENKEGWNKRTPEQRARYNAARREKYANDESYKNEQKAKVKEWQAMNPKKRKSQRLKTYGMSLDEFNALLKKQDGKCAICGYSDISDKNRFPLVDHDHTTGKNRGLLCLNCNQAIGKLKDDPELMIRAAEYIEMGGVLNGEVADLV